MGSFKRNRKLVSIRFIFWLNTINRAITHHKNNNGEIPMTIFKLSSCFIAIWALSACGGGSSNHNSSSSAAMTSSSSLVISSSSSLAINSSSSSTASSLANATSLRLEAEDYLDYYDTNAENKAGADYRTGDGVDIEATTDTGGGYDVGYIDSGEWLEFAVNVSVAGNFTADVRVASAQDGGKLYFEIDGTKVGDDISTPNTGGWQTWSTVNGTLGSLSAGDHHLCVQMKSGPFNLNWIELKSADGGTATAIKPAKSGTSVCEHPVAPPVVTVPTKIRLNQIGFLPDAQKIAVVPAVAATTFSIVDSSNVQVATGNLTAEATWEPVLESVKIADFSSLTQPGTYKIQIAGVDDQPTFTISTTVYNALNAAAIKALYFNRASIALNATYAGEYARAAGHPDTMVKIHASAATVARPEGTIISAPKGWYDAGDYNKYIVNSGITTYTLLAAFEKFPNYFSSQNINIPESGNSVPDVLNETMWNLEWMLAMQDPNDGGVYHKLTSKGFSGFEMPATDTSERFVVQKTTAATLDFAAVMATASRIYANYETVYPGISAKMLVAAKSAYSWAKANPAIYYSQPSDIVTGAYGDDNVNDEFAWASAELYISTQDDTYYSAMNINNVSATIPSWGGVQSLALISLAHNLNNLTAAADKTLIKNKIDVTAASLVTKKQSSAFSVSLEKGDFFWGSNSGAMNQAIMLLEAYQLDETKHQYLDAAQSLFDYVLGRNPTDYSFVTGFGTKSPLHIHHRPSSADGIAAPIPGFLAGGATLDGTYDCTPANYPSPLIAKSYLDDECSYSTNEIAINWNAPLVYVSAAIQVLTTK
jgi:endoglucanase